MVNILVVEDDEKLNKIICAYLNSNGYGAVGCANPAQALGEMVDVKFDLIVSDIMMPQIDGFQFASQVREHDKVIPILFMSSRDDLSSKEKGFRIGIDDYMVKPVDMDELLLRVGALIRRANIANDKKLTVGSVTLNADETTATLNGEEIPLTVKEFQLLFKLLSYPKRTFTRIQLMDQFWELGTDTTPRSVDVYISKLREKFAACDDFEIVTVHGLGYKAVLK